MRKIAVEIACDRTGKIDEIEGGGVKECKTCRYYRTICTGCKELETKYNSGMTAYVAPVYHNKVVIGCSYHEKRSNKCEE